MGKFKGFGGYTGDDFHKHINASIPSYKRINDMCMEIADFFLMSGGRAVDVGCSDGRIVKALSAKGYKVTGIEVEGSFHKKLEEDGVNVFKESALLYEYEDIGFAIMLFTLQFIEMRKRQWLINKIYEGMNDGGALIIAEKTYGESTVIDGMMNSMYYQFKRADFSGDEILDKEVTLRGMMMIKKRSEIEKMLYSAGFSHVDIIWKDMMFAGILAIK